ncbi:MAG: DUF86 domain-containing protein [Deltaproteobacteria bacterium]|nr:DUF86 domain-containing protein [Deltaproteobacteria bacterium]
MTFQEYTQCLKTQAAVERAIEIVGEAAGRVSETFRDEHPEVPWRGMIAQRNVLAHDYGQIVHERLWLVVTERLPELIQLLEPILPPLPEDA